MKLSRLRVWIFFKYLAIIIIAATPLACYVWQFHDTTISSDPNDWAAFGSYIGGIYSIIVAILVVYLTRELSKKDKALSKRKEAIEVIYQQIVKIKSDSVNTNAVNKLFSLLDDNKIYIDDSVYNEVESLANYFLEVKAGGSSDYKRENRVKEHLRSIYNA